MNTKLALSSAIVAALMLTACAKQESAGTDQAAAPPAPAASDAAKDANAGSAGQAADQSAAGQAAPQAGDAAKSAEGSGTPPNPPSDTSTPPKQ
jgi:hypothetical protein